MTKGSREMEVGTLLLGNKNNVIAKADLLEISVFIFFDKTYL